jgi:hypothetical protein
MCLEAVVSNTVLRVSLRMKWRGKVPDGDDLFPKPDMVAFY